MVLCRCQRRMASIVRATSSPNTVASYRDTFRLLMRFASARHGKPPVKLAVEDIDADLVADFLVHTETARGNSARSRQRAYFSGAKT